MTTYRPDVDGLRAVAVLLVVMYHAEIPGFGGGFVGVDVFFVISGFLITSIIRREIAAGEFSFLRFYERRVRRIMPALVAVWAASFCVAAYAMLPSEFAGFATRLAASAMFVSNVALYRESGYFDVASEEKPLLHTWSLSVEEQFYLIWPVLLLACWRLGPRVGGALLAVGLVASLAYAEWLLGVDKAAAFFLLPSRFWELGIGAALALTWGRLKPGKAVSGALGAVGLLFILFAAATLRGADPFPGFAAMSACVGAVLLILSGQDDRAFVSRLLAWRPLVFVGLISYSLYLWHWPILAFSRLTWGDLGWAGTSAALVGSFVAACLSWRFVERPFRKGRSRGCARTLRDWAAIPMATAVALGVFVVSSDGLRWRVSPEALDYDADAGRGVNTFEACRDGQEGNGSGGLGIRCAFGAPGEVVDLVLYGDSHAKHLLGAVADSSRSAGLTGVLVAEGGCPPVARKEAVGTRADGSARPECRPQAANFKRVLRENAHIRVIVLAARWENYAKPTVADGRAGLRLEGEPGLTTREVMLQEIGRHAETATRHGAGLLLVGQVPRVGNDVVRCVRRTHVFGGDPGSCRPERHRMADILKHARSMLVEAARRNPGVVFVDPFPAMCPADRCLQRADELMGYADWNHLNLRGSRSLGRVVTPELLLDVSRGADASEPVLQGAPK